MKLSSALRSVGIALAAAPARVLAQPVGPDRALRPAPAEPPPGWDHFLFHFNYPMAIDYVLLAVAPVVGVVIAFIYYRAVLHDAVMQMQRPAGVKLRAAGVGLIVAGLILMLAPNLPIGWLAILVLLGVVMAASFGLSILIAAALLVVGIVILIMKVMNLI
jgi:hypothetical protein